MSTSLTPQQRFDLITRGLDGIQGADEIKAILANGNNPKGLWEAAPTGRPHIGYLIPIIKLAEFLRAGVEVTFCLGDLYAFLVNYKHSFELVGHRTQFYKFVLGAALEAVGAPIARVNFVLESPLHLTKRGLFDSFRLCTLASQRHAKETGEELSNTAMLSPLLCPGVQVLDEEYLGVDFDLGGTDQRGIFAYGDNYLPQLGYRKRGHLYNPLLPGLNGGKMSASDPGSKIDCLDSPETVDRKISNVNLQEGDVARNGILGIVKMVLIPISRLRLESMQDAGGAQDMADQRPFSSADAPEGTLFTIGTGTKDGAPRHYKSYDEVERDYVEKRLGPEELKLAVAGAIKQVLAPIRRLYESNEEWQAVEKLAYPDPEEKDATLTTVPFEVNFCYPVRELSNDLIKLTPFNPVLHAASYFAHTSPYPEVYTHMPLGPFVSPADFTVNFFDVVARPNPTMMFYAVIDKTLPPAEDADGALAGMLAYINTSTANQSTEIGYVVTFPAFQRTHVTSNAVGLLLQYALDPPTKGGLGLRRVQWQTSSANDVSMRAADKLGFRKEGVLRWDRVFYGGGSKGKQGNGKQVPEGDGEDLGRDTVVYSICWADWEEGGRGKIMDVMERRN